MEYAFTGTSTDLPSRQLLSLNALVYSLKDGITGVRHGGCVGADKAFHDVLLVQGMLHLLTVHPGHITSKRAQLPGTGFTVLEPAYTLDRNKQMVWLTDQLIACPKEYEEIKRSGTWATIRAARRAKKPITFVWPDGTVTVERDHVDEDRA